MGSSKVLHFSDPVPYQAAIRAADVEVYPTRRGRFQAELTQINLDRLWMQRFNETLPKVDASRIRPGRRVIGFLTDANQPSVQNCGREFSPQEIVISSDDVMHHRTAGDYRFGAMSLTTDDFDVLCKAVVGHEFPEDKLKHVVRPSPDLMMRLTRLHGTVGQMAKTTPDILELPEVSRALEQQLVHVMVRCMTEGIFSNITAAGRRHDMIIARFKEFLEANPNTPLYMPEICAAVGAAERTLRVACEEHLGMGPIRYLALRRMHLVRRALLQANPWRTTVTRIATDHGFWEMGRFSGAYRALFGETPSATLQRLSKDRRVRLNRRASVVSSETELSG
jgi:AraC-like DNA-binding protein